MNAHPAADRPPAMTSIGGSPTVALQWRPILRFVAEFLAMCAVMCVSGSVLNAIFFDALGYSYLVHQAPAVAVLVIVVNLTVPMAVYMAVRGHGWGHNLTMSAGTVAVGVLVIGALSFGLVAPSSLRSWSPLYGLVCGPACVVMFVEMLFSFGMYGGRTDRHGHARGG